MKHYIRFLSIVLCFVLTFVVFAKPLQVSAIEPVTMSIGALGAIAEVLPYIAVAGFLLLAGGYVIESLPTFIDDVNSWLNTLPDVKEWTLTFSQKLEEGSVIIIPEFVQEAIRQKAEENNKKTPEKIPYIVLPPNFHQLDQLTQEQLFNQEINQTLQQGNSLLSQIKNSITGFAGKVTGLFENLGSLIQSSVQGISSTFKAEFDQFKTWYKNINDNLKEEIHQIPNWLSSINTNMKNELGQIKTWFSNVNSTIKNEIAGIKTTLGQIKDTAIGKVTTAVDNVGKKIDSLIDTIKGTLPPNNGSGGVDNENANDTINSGINGMIPFFGSGKDYLAEYSTGFLAAGLLFNSFADIPFINQLLFVSVTIGMVGTLLGIALNVAQSESTARSSKKSKVGDN